MRTEDNWDLSKVDWDLRVCDWDLTGDEVYVYKIQKRGNEWCVVSEDGTKKLGCYPTEKQARERLRQIEAAKAAKGNVIVEGEERGGSRPVTVVVNVDIPEQEPPVVNVSMPDQPISKVEVLNERKPRSRRVERDSEDRIVRIIDEDV